MLTENGYRDRFWRGYPHLRQLLERKDSSVPTGVDLLALVTEDESRISIDHGPLGRLADVLAIARLLASHANEVQDVMRVDPSSVTQITGEVGQLLDELEGSIHAFHHALARACGREVEVTRTVVRDVQELGWRLRSEG